LNCPVRYNSTRCYAATQGRDETTSGGLTLSLSKMSCSAVPTTPSPSYRNAVVLAVMHAPVECGASARGSAGKKPAHRPDGQAERGGGGRRSVRTDTERRRALVACRGRSRGGRSGRYLYLTERAPRPVAIGAPACVAARPAPGATPKLTSRARPRIPDVHFVSRHEGKLDRARTENHRHTGGSNQRREKGSSYGAQSQSAST